MFNFNVWNFPMNNGGQVRGIADAGLETFGGKEIKSLIREICQNSLDAVYDKSKPVKVEFMRESKKVSDMPGYEDFKVNLMKCHNFWAEENSAKATAFLKNAVKNIQKDHHFVLRISDYNTIGLKDPYANTFSGWNALTKIDGGATKSGDSGGSFGIGKNAPFCFSNYRVVFYRTLNLAGEHAAQGMSRLMSFPTVKNAYLDNFTSGIGYFGNPQGNKPVNYIQNLDDLESRKEVGTDVFIYGFTVDGDDWFKSAITAVLENFLVAIYQGKLSVKIQSKEINKETLGSFIEEYKLELKHAYFNYEALQSPCVVEKTVNFHNLGELKLSAIVSKKEKKDQQVLIVRSSGMKLFSLKRIAKQINFSGVLELVGEHLNAFFREMETPTHDRWETGRHSDPKLAKKYYEELKDIVRNFIWEQEQNSSTDETDVEGLSDLLLDDVDDLSENKEEKESLNDSISITPMERKHVSSAINQGIFYGSGGKQKNKSERKKGTVGTKGEHSAIRSLGGNRTRKKSQKHKGTEDENGRDTILQPSGSDDKVVLHNTRIMYVGNQIYKLSFTLPQDIDRGYIELATVGENGKNNLVKVDEILGTSGSSCEIKNGKIFFYGMKSGCRNNIRFTILDSQQFAMEVHVYEID